MNKINEVMDILDKINTIAEGTPERPFPEIHRLSGDALKILNRIK